MTVSEALTSMWREDAEAAVNAGRFTRMVDTEFDSGDEDMGDVFIDDDEADAAMATGTRMRDLLSRAQRRGTTYGRRFCAPPPPLPPLPQLPPTPPPTPTQPAATQPALHTPFK